MTKAVGECFCHSILPLTYPLHIFKKADVTAAVHVRWSCRFYYRNKIDRISYTLAGVQTVKMGLKSARRPLICNQEDIECYPFRSARYKLPVEVYISLALH